MEQFQRLCRERPELSTITSDSFQNKRGKINWILEENSLDVAEVKLQGIDVSTGVCIGAAPQNNIGNGEETGSDGVCQGF